MRKCAEVLGLTLRWHTVVVSRSGAVHGVASLRRRVGSTLSSTQKAIEVVHVIVLVLVYYMMLGMVCLDPDPRSLRSSGRNQTSSSLYYWWFSSNLSELSEFSECCTQ